MANVFFTNSAEEEDKNRQIPSVAYVNSVIKQLADIINVPAAQAVNFDKGVTKEMLYVADDKVEETAPEDFNHRTLTDAQIDIFKSKASKLDVHMAIDQLRAELKSYYQAQFNQLLNDDNALSKIKDIAYMIREEATLDSFMDTLASKVGEDTFKDHEASSAHLNNADRNALNQLIKMIQLGGMDWSAEEGEPNAIKNKPISMPANGGNADTVGGYSTNFVLNHQLETFIFGDSETREYSYELCDLAMNIANPDITKIMISTINDCKSGIFGFRSGQYNFKNVELNDCSSSKSIRGSGYNSTVFNLNGGVLKIGKNIEIKNLTVANAIVEITSRVVLDNVTFENCTIRYKSSSATTVRNCVFEKCAIVIDGAWLDNMFVCNRLMYSNIPIYYGGNNLVSNNIVS